MISPMQGRFTSGYRTAARPSHLGIDIAPPVAGTTGFPVYAAFGGTVVRVATTRRPGQTDSVGAIAPGRTGNGVLIRNSDGEYQLYNHVAPTVKAGVWVAEGTLIARGDRSGNQTGPHLHFETWRANQTTYNPATVFSAHGITIGSAPRFTQDTSSTAVNKDYQARLHTVGAPYYNGAIDGVGGSMWDAAVRQYQSDNNLHVDGYFGPVSVGHFDNQYRDHFHNVQGYLASRTNPGTGQAFYTGARDGYSGQMTYNSTVAFQQHHGLTPHGVWGNPEYTKYVASSGSYTPAPPADNSGGSFPGDAGDTGNLPPGYTEPEEVKPPPKVWDPWPEVRSLSPPRPEWPIPAGPTRPEQLVDEYADPVAKHDPGLMSIYFL